MNTQKLILILVPGVTICVMLGLINWVVTGRKLEFDFSIPIFVISITIALLLMLYLIK